MIELCFLTILVPIVDQGVKHGVRRWIGDGERSLGSVGSVRVVSTQVWALRVARGGSVRLLWAGLVVAGAAGFAVAYLIPGLGWAFGLLLGGALSHTLETARRGSICDFICLRFWPPFNLADVALAAGAAAVPFALRGALL